MSDELKACPACHQQIKQVGSFRWFHQDWPCVFNGVQIEGPGMHEWNRVADVSSLESRLKIAVEALEQVRDFDCWSPQRSIAQLALAKIRST